MILAVDGGNSKTDVALLAEDGALLAHVRGPLSSPHHLGLAGCVDMLQDLVDQVGLDGTRRPRADHARRARLSGGGGRRARCVRGVRLGRRTRVGNDTFAVLRAGTERGWGIAVTCGAGMNCVGVSPDGRHVRFPALGEHHRRLGRRLRRRARRDRRRRPEPGRPRAGHRARAAGAGALRARDAARGRPLDPRRAPAAPPRGRARAGRDDRRRHRRDRTEHRRAAGVRGRRASPGPRRSGSGSTRREVVVGGGLMRAADDARRSPGSPRGSRPD